MTAPHCYPVTVGALLAGLSRVLRVMEAARLARNGDTMCIWEDDVKDIKAVESYLENVPLDPAQGEKDRQSASPLEESPLFDMLLAEHTGAHLLLDRMGALKTIEGDDFIQDLSIAERIQNIPVGATCKECLQVQAALDEFVLVPREPTKEMIQAAIWALDRWREKHGNVQGHVPPGEKYQIRWKAMLEAASQLSSTDSRSGERL